MKQTIAYIFCFIVLLQSKIVAQDASTTTEQLIADIFEQYAAETEQELDFDSFYEDLIDLADNPIQLNDATREELEKLPFLSGQQIENILYYIYKFGNLNTIYELQLIDGLDMTDVRRMLPFVVAGKNDTKFQKIYWQDLIKYGKHEILYRMDRNLNEKAGYLTSSEIGSSPNYTGSPFYNSLKYHFRFKERILAGMSMEKDAGEQFLGNRHQGYDFYSTYAQINDIGKLKTIVIGDFRAGFGMVLVLQSRLGMGKSSYVTNVIPRSAGLRKFSSTDEYNFFRGIGATLKSGEVEFSAFYSNKMIDGDTIDGSFGSINKSGLHRTLSELENKHTVNQQLAGFNSTFTHKNFQLGVTLAHTILNQKIVLDTALYNHFYFSGNKQTTAGLNYRLRLHKFNFFGETALSNQMSMATLNGMSFSPISSINLVALMRYFSPEYDTFYANTFSEGSRINNETGVYLGAEIRPFKKWKIAAYAEK